MYCKIAVCQGTLSFDCKFLHLYFAFNNFPRLKNSDRLSWTLSPNPGHFHPIQTTPTASRVQAVLLEVQCLLAFVSKSGFRVSPCFLQQPGTFSGQIQVCSSLCLLGARLRSTGCIWIVGKYLTLRFKEPSPLLTSVSLPNWVSKSLNINCILQMQNLKPRAELLFTWGFKFMLLKKREKKILKARA